nr:zinc finger, PHD-type [Tanacetum cinerariifolium]
MESNLKFENVITLIQHEHPLHLVDLQPCYPDYREFSDDEEEDRVIKWDFKSPCSQCGKDINVYHSKGATSSNVSSISGHDPMKRIELLCNGCVRPIMDVPFYKCSSEEQCCDFVLHEWCTRLPAELPYYPDHPQHTLVFVSKVPDYKLFRIFYCGNCKLYCNGFAYGCTECNYYIDVNCGFIPEEITHEAHPDHILSRCDRESMRWPCVAEAGLFFGSEITFSCGSCAFYLHYDCAFFLPGIINHKLDKHPMKLTYGPVENHKSEYFCEVCEEKFNPNLWFYHCHICAYSLHTSCAPVIVEFEAAGGRNCRSLYECLNIMFGGAYNIKGHDHFVSLAIGSHVDGECPICYRGLIKTIIVNVIFSLYH